MGIAKINSEIFSGEEISIFSPAEISENPLSRIFTIFLLNNYLLKSTQPHHSTVSFVRCNGGLFSADVTFNFSITYRRPPFSVPQYSQYQFFLYETITAHREKGKTFDQIAEWLNKEGYLSIRGKKFRGAHVHSIVKKKRLKLSLIHI